MGTQAEESIQKDKGFVDLIKCADYELLVLVCDISPYGLEQYYHINWDQMSNQLLLYLVP